LIGEEFTPKKPKKKKGLAESVREFAEASRQFAESQEVGARESNQQGLVGSAREFADGAEKLKNKLSPAQPTLDIVPTREQGFLGAATDLNAKMYAEAHIIPQIDSLIDRHTDGSGIPKSEIESTFKNIMNEMVQENVLTREEMEAYIAPSKVAVKQTGLLSAFKKTEYVDGPSQFEKDINSSMEFKGDKLESPNLQSFKDKLINGLSKICNSLGLKGLAKACRQSISKDNLEKTYKAEAGLSNLTSKVVKEAKAIGKAGTSEAKRVGERTQDILAKRQQPKNSGHSR